MRMHRSIYVLVLTAATGVFALPIVAQQQVVLARQTTDSGSKHLSPAVLQKIVAPIALHPDDLLSVVLPVSIERLQLAEPQRFLDQHKTHPSAKPPWDRDPSVVALLN